MSDSKTVTPGPPPRPPIMGPLEISQRLHNMEQRLRAIERALMKSEPVSGPPTPPAEVQPPADESIPAMPEDVAESEPPPAAP